jgi:hypothetical protein
MFGLFGKKSYEVRFTEERAEQMKIVLTDIYEILRDEAYSAQANCVKEILVTVHSEDVEGFRGKVLSNELLGGSGSVVDVWIQNPENRETLDKRLNEFLNLTLQSGLTHRSVKSRITD